MKNQNFVFENCSSDELIEINAGGVAGAFVGAIIGGAVGLVVVGGNAVINRTATAESIWKTYVTFASMGAAIGLVTNPF